MKKLLLFMILIIPLNVGAVDFPQMNYEKGIVYDITDDVIRYNLEGDKEASIASLTKIMTTILAIEKIDDYDKKVTYTSNIDSQIVEGSSRAGLKVGESYTYDDLLYASILPSGADATTTLAISLSGSLDNFVKDMNKLAKKLEMNNTHFVNVTGIEEEGHYSTCEDLLKLLKYALENPKFKEIYTTKNYTLTNGLTVKSTVIAYAGNNDTTRILGSKTGFTYNAGRCISIYFKSNNHEYIAITLGAPNTSSSIHIIDALGLIAFIDDNYDSEVIVEKKSFKKEIPVENSNVDLYVVVNKEDVVEYIEKDYDKDKITIEYEGEEELSFFNKKDTKIGKINYYYDKKLLASEDVILDTTIKPNIFKIALSNWYIILIILFISFIGIKYHKKVKRRRKRRI